MSTTRYRGPTSSSPSTRRAPRALLRRRQQRPRAYAPARILADTPTCGRVALGAYPRYPLSVVAVFFVFGVPRLVARLDGLLPVLGRGARRVRTEAPRGRA